MFMRAFLYVMEKSQFSSKLKLCKKATVLKWCA